MRGALRYFLAASGAVAGTSVTGPATSAFSIPGMATSLCSTGTVFGASVMRISLRADGLVAGWPRAVRMCWGNQNRYEGGLVRVVLTEDPEVIGASPQGTAMQDRRSCAVGLACLRARDAA